MIGGNYGLRDASASPPPKKGRRKNHHERRLGHRGERRCPEERREATVTRSLVTFFRSLRLHGAADLIKFTKTLKVFKPLLTFLSGAFSAWVHSFSMGIALAVGLIVALAVHEGGHYRAIRGIKRKSSLWLHIPIVGARMKMPETLPRRREARIAFGGPFVGGCFSLALFALWGIWFALGLPFGKELLYGAIISAGINLFNMIPLLPMDGGRITQAIHPWLRYVGFAILLALTGWYKEAAMLVIWMVILDEGIDRLKGKNGLKLILATILFVCTVVLIALGYHSKWIWEDIIFAVFGAYLLVNYYYAYRFPPVEEAERPLPCTIVRLAWLFRWLGLGALLTALMALEIWAYVVTYR